MVFEDMDSRNKVEDEEAFREGQVEDIRQLQEELKISREQLDEFVWQAKLDELRNSGKFSEEWIRRYEKARKDTKDSDTAMAASKLSESFEVRSILDKRNHLDWELYALQKEKNKKGNK